MLAGLAGAASATTFTGNFSISGSAFTDPGLVLQTSTTSGGGSFDLEVGEWAYFELFTVWTEETTVNADDLVGQSINVDFVFTDPAVSGGLSGSSTGVISCFGFCEYGVIDWANPLILTFGGTGKLLLSLSDVTFNFGILGLHEGEKHGASVKLKVKYLEAPSQVPLPAGGVLLIGALGGLAMVRRRRKS
ncbi:VPLPA-CTERM sorting domain-containing protein [Pseudoruegeria sp. HB172150]|uniref:VPLPA-CTERM sorting domain-containing protein n=1 Tax=Pseudoruegeria sp. HB172150 TaxID=2721164 RepID=UPI001C12E330|nr:VPLPA-CTERM sorting domain-containing protein [Pseudoruegeria sp. HB172150]